MTKQLNGHHNYAMSARKELAQLQLQMPLNVILEFTNVLLKMDSMLLKLNAM